MTRTPRPATARARTELVRRGYDAVSELYRADDADPAWYEDWLAGPAGRLPTHARVLDLGCGCGIPVARRLTDLGHRVLGADLSRVQIARARRLVPGARFLRADAADLRFDPGSFDAIVCLYVLIHHPERDQVAVVGRIGSWLRPGGVLIATVGARRWSGEEADWLGSGAPMWWCDPGAGTYREWLTAAGLTIERDEFVPEGDAGHQLFVARRRG